MRTPADLVALARHASTSSSYKPALLKALVRIVRRTVSNEISLETIGAEFVSLYWVQTVTFRLRQAPTLTKQPEVVKAIRATADGHHVRKLDDLPAAARARLDARMAKILRINVLNAFHASAPVGMVPLFSWSSSDDHVYLTSESRAFITTHAPVLESIANLWWARLLEKFNLLAPLVIEKVERDGARRSSLTRYLQLLLRSDERRCFYCDRALEERSPIHVDHVIPWSFLLCDPIWDLVLSCVPCNLSKSDILPAHAYIEKLAVLGAHRAKLDFPRGFASALLPGEDLERYYQAALGVEWPAGWKPMTVNPHAGGSTVSNVTRLD